MELHAIQVRRFQRFRSHRRGAFLAGKRFRDLPGLFRTRLGPQLLKPRSKVVRALVQVAPQSSHGVEIAARSVPALLFNSLSRSPGKFVII
jgi:hypothetical protein